MLLARLASATVRSNTTTSVSASRFPVTTPRRFMASSPRIGARTRDEGHSAVLSALSASCETSVAPRSHLSAVPVLPARSLSTCCPAHKQHEPSSVSSIVDDASALLPHQPILENFVHHNPLEHMQSLAFQDAVNFVHKVEQYMSPGERVFQLVHVDPRKRVKEALVDLSSAFLDRGAAKWIPSFRHRGFLYFFASLEQLGFAGWRSYARSVAARVLSELDAPAAQQEHQQPQQQHEHEHAHAHGHGDGHGHDHHASPQERAIIALAEQIVAENLEAFGIPRHEWTDATRAMMLELRGWAGMFNRMQHHPSEAPANTTVRLLEFCAVQTTLIRSSIEALARQAGWDPTAAPLAEWLSDMPANRTDLMSREHVAVHTSAIAIIDQNAEQRDALEARFRETLLRAVASRPVPPPTTATQAASSSTASTTTTPPPAATTAATATSGSSVAASAPTPPQPPQSSQAAASSTSSTTTSSSSSPSSAAPRAARPSFQLYTCIDDRECSLRRHVEATNPNDIETFGVAGFFGVPVRYQPADGRDQMILAPEGQNPSAILVEVTKDEKAERYRARRRLFARLSMLWERASFSPLGSLIPALCFPFSVVRLYLMGVFPTSKLAVKDSVIEAVRKPQTDFQLPFSPQHAAKLLASTFKDIGTHRRFAPIVVILGHGASSVNNPFAAAYNCGACGGREGGPSARLFARLANDKDVRHYLRVEHDITIPDDTLFVGGMHNTTADTVEFFDTDKLTPSQRARFYEAQSIIERARGENALERCHRFLLAQQVRTPQQALEHVRLRASDPAEVRPELNHATNAAVVVGRRALTKGRFLDRRVFLSSYDPFSDDDVGTNLEHVLAPAFVVCSGINLEYFFSTIRVEQHGAGTKAPLNVVGNIGALQGTAGDLRTGLPTQMTEMHSPIRAHYIIDAPIARVEAVLSRRPQLRDLAHNEWVMLFVRDPYSGEFFQYVRGNYEPLHIVSSDTTNTYVPFTHHRTHGLKVAQREAIIYAAANAAMVLSCAIPVLLFGAEAMNPRGVLIACGGTLLSLPVLAFARRYLHGEYMFGRFAALTASLLLGFNIVATAPSLMHILGGWSLFGFASTFLIGAYNDRPTVRNNATFAFAAYRFSDFALLVAATFSLEHALAHGHTPYPSLVAASIIIAALFKSSQFPLTSLFVRSMEGPTPASALGYAGLSAHAGVVLLTSTLPLWYPFDFARIAVGACGLFTTVYATLASKTRAERKGALANATAATLGVILVTLVLGHPDLALLLSFGHASYRMIQVLRSPNIIADSQRLRSALTRLPFPRVVADSLYRLAWRLRRFDSDCNWAVLHLIHWLSRHTGSAKKLALTKTQQWITTTAAVVLAGAPFTPLTHFMEEKWMEWLPTHPVLATTTMAAHFLVSVVLIRFVFVKVLSGRRFFGKSNSNNNNNNSTTTTTNNNGGNMFSAGVKQ